MDEVVERAERLIDRGRWVEPVELEEVDVVGLQTAQGCLDRVKDVPAGTRFTLGNAAPTYQGRYWHDRDFDTVDQLLPLAEEAGVSLVTLSVAWVLANKAITAPIIGASRPDQLASSLEAAELMLEDDLKRRLDELTREYRTGEAP